MNTCMHNSKHAAVFILCALCFKTWPREWWWLLWFFIYISLRICRRVGPWKLLASVEPTVLAARCSLISSKFNRHSVANKGQERKPASPALPPPPWLQAAENSDHALLCIITIWAFGPLYLPPNEKQRSALEGLACFRQWKKSQGREIKKKKSSRNNSNHLCPQGTWELCLNKLCIQKLRWCPTCYLLMWHEMAI